MAVNKKHPDYQAYKAKWDKLSERMNHELDQLPPSPTTAVLDGDGFSTVAKKYAKKFKELQEEYKHLSTNKAS